MEVEIIKKNEGKVDKSTGKLLSGNLRVAAYARVSTDSEDQATSFISQQKYYMEKIYSNPNWSYVEVYADEGISGTQAFKRENFMRMIKDAEEGKIDLILTKSISRFARNTLDTLKYVRMLRAKGIGIIFEEENINTLEMAGELLLTVLSSVAQQESETLSSHIKLGFKMKMERGELVGFSNCYGYYYDSKKNEMHIKEDEAEIVKLIFSYYLQGYGCKTISQMLGDMKILSPRGLDRWHENTVRNILQNEKYIGDAISGKTFTVDAVTHKRVVNNGESDKFYVKNHHEPIISREDFEKVKKIFETRNHSVLTGRKMGKKFSFSGRLRCGFCGHSYCKKSLYKKREAWDCISVAKKGRMYCPDSKVMHDDVIKSCFMEAYFLLTKDRGLVIDNFINSLKDSARDTEPAKMKLKIENEIKVNKNKLSKLVDLYVDGKVDNNTFESKQNDLQSKISKLEEKQDKLSQIVNEDKKVDIGIKKIKTELQIRESSNEIKPFDEDLFEALVDYAIIGAYDTEENKINYIIRFICKKGFELRSREDISEDVIIENNHIDSKDNIYLPIIDFVSNQNFFVFDDTGAKRRKTLISKVRVRVEIEK